MDEINTPEDFNNALNEATITRDKKLSDDPEFVLAKYHHKHTLITAASVGILDSYAFYHSYQVPPHFELVLNEIARKLLEHFKNENEVFKVSLITLKRVYREIFYSIPQYIEWNSIGDPEGAVHFSSRYDITPDAPSFICLEVPVMNSVVYLRDKKRADEAFDEQFEKDWAINPFNPICMGRAAFQEGKTEADNPFKDCPTTGVPTTKNPNGQDMCAEWLQGFNEEKSKNKPKKFVFIKTTLQNAFDDNNKKITVKRTAYWNKRCNWFSVNILEGMVEDFTFDEHEGMPGHIEGRFVPFDENMIYKQKQGRIK